MNMAIGGGVESMSRIGHWRLRRRLARRSLAGAQELLSCRRASPPISSPPNMAFRATMSTPMRWKASGARRSRGRAGIFSGRRAGEGSERLALLDRDEHMRPETTMQSLGALKPSFAEMGETYGFDAGGDPALSRGRGHRARASCRQFLRHRRWRGGGPARLGRRRNSAAACSRAPGSAPLPISARNHRSC